MTLLNFDGTSPKGTFSEDGGVATLTMSGPGNSLGGVQLDYTTTVPTDPTSGGNNTQFFLMLRSIVRRLANTTAAQINIKMTDASGVRGDVHPGSAASRTVSIPPTTCARAPRSTVQSASRTATGKSTSRASPASACTSCTPDPGPNERGDHDSARCHHDDAEWWRGTVRPVGERDVAKWSNGDWTSRDAGDVSRRPQLPGGPGPTIHLVDGRSDCHIGYLGIPAGTVSDSWADDNTVSNEAVATVALDVAPTRSSAAGISFTTIVPGAFHVTATGNPAPTIAQTGTLPSRVTFNPTTAILSGTPAAGTAGPYSLTF